MGFKISNTFKWVECIEKISFRKNQTDKSPLGPNRTWISCVCSSAHVESIFKLKDSTRNQPFAPLHVVYIEVMDDFLEGNGHGYQIRVAIYLQIFLLPTLKKMY